MCIWNTLGWTLYKSEYVCITPSATVDSFVLVLESVTLMVTTAQKATICQVTTMLATAEFELRVRLNIIPEYILLPKV